MPISYNANLIAELYTTNDAEKANNICEEMVDIGDAIFPRQIYEAYKKFYETTFSHYFVLHLTRFKSENVAEILKEIAHTTTKNSDIFMMLDYLSDIKYFEPEIIDKVIKSFKEDLILRDAQEYEIEQYFKYIQNSGREIQKLELFLLDCFENDNQNIKARKVALKKLLKLEPRKYINFYYENYDRIKGKKAEIIFVEEISTWINGIIPQLHKKIQEDGSVSAQEILKAKLSSKVEEKQSKTKKEQEKIKEVYATADVISDIARLRIRVNKLSLADKRFGFSFLSSMEEVYEQNRPAQDKTTFIGYCIVIRSLIQGFSDKIKELEVSEERMREILPEVTDLEGSIKKFHFLLLDKGLNVDNKIFGIRNINRIVSILAHPDAEFTPELIKILKEEKLLDLYQEDNWPMLHRGILIKYKSALEELISALSQTN